MSTSKNGAATPSDKELIMGSDNSSNDDWEEVKSGGLYDKKRSYSTNSINSAVSEEKLNFMDLLDPGLTVKVSKKAFTRVKSKTKNITDKAKIQKNKLFEKINDEDLVLLKKKLAKKISQLDQNLSKNIEASRTEKAFYSFCLVQFFYAGVLLGKYPNYFHLYYSLLFCLLMPIRLYSFWKKDFQFFLADLCYFVNILVMLYIWVFPNSKHLYSVCFSFTFGTLAWAVILWRNSLVLHSIDKITSSFIHIVPPCVMFVITHEIDHDFKLKRFPGAANFTSWNFFHGILWTSFYYLIWQSAYHYFITYKQKDIIKQGRVNSFSYLRKSYANKPIGKFVNGLPEPLPVVAFTLIQYGYQVTTMLFCPIFYKYKRAASLFMGFIFIVAAYNGATYYLDYFGKKLEKEVLKLQNEIAMLQTENMSNSSSASSVVQPEELSKSTEFSKKTL